MKRSLITLSLAAAMLAAGVAGTSTPAFSQPPGAQFTTNFALLNAGSGAAQVVVNYYTGAGGQWRTPQTLNLGINGRASFDQLNDTALTPGQGSVVVSADQPIASVVQVRARNQNPTSSGAYSGITTGSREFFVPLVARNRNTVSGLANSQIVIQNLGQVATTAVISFVRDGELVPSVFVTTPVIPPNASFYYNTQTTNDLPNNWIGSATVGGLTSDIGVVATFFAGNTMQTFNAFSRESLSNEWVIPLFAFRRGTAGGARLSTVLTIQNLSTSTIQTGTLTLSCTPRVSGFSSFTDSNQSAFAPRARYDFNPVPGTSGLGFGVNVPQNYIGSCRITAPQNVVVLVQMRFITGDPLTEEAAAHEAFPANSTATQAFVPLMAKRLPNGFATVATIQNLDATNPATVTLQYVGDGTNPSVVLSDTIPAAGSLSQNLRITSGSGAVPALPDGWVGALRITSNRPIAVMTELTFLRPINPNLPGGDLYMAHNPLLQ